MECWNVRTLFYTAIFTLMVFCPDTVQGQCEKINDCRCKLPNGTFIDLSKIGNKGGSKPKYPYARPDDDPTADWEYSFNGCYSYSDKYCTGAVACQRSTDHTKTPGSPLGNPDTAEYNDGSLLQFLAVGPDGQLRNTEVKLICDESGKPEKSTLKILGESSDDYVYKYELTSKCACANGCSGGGGSSAGSGGGRLLSIGSILCIVFSGFAVVYMVGGMLYMRLVHGAEGKELIPNVTIWMQFPSLVKDGAVFVISFVLPGARKSDYDTGI